MKNFNRNHLAILPLLSILAMSPSVMESNFASRAIASVDPETKTEVKTEVNEEVKGHPKYEALVSKVDQNAIMKDVSLDIEKFKAKREELKSKLSKEREEFKKDQSDKDIVAEQRKNVESLVIDIILVEGGLKDLQEKKAIETSEEEISSKLLSESKDIIEGILTDLEANEVLVAKANEPKPEEPKAEEEKPVIADNEEPKKEEPKVEEPKVEEPKKEVVVVSEEPKKEEPKKEEETKPVVADKEEPKKEEAKEEPKKEVCEADEKNKVLTTQVEELMKQNQQILQTMMGMAQMMVSMHQQTQNQNIYQQYQQMPMPNPYMYQQPMSAGNWVYYPSGFQPQQQNIFAQPQQQPLQQQMSMYPDQMHQQQPQWNLRPSQYFGDQRFQSQPLMPGTFGNEAFTFNMGNSVPTVSQT